MVLDEAAFMDQEVWAEVIRPALADKQGGRCLLVHLMELLVGFTICGVIAEKPIEMIGKGGVLLRLKGVM